MTNELTRLERDLKRVAGREPKSWTATRPWRGFRQHKCGDILISGSSQPDPRSIQLLFLRQDIDIDVDLRQEPHVCARDPEANDPVNDHGYLRLSVTNRYDRPDPGISRSNLRKLEERLAEQLNRSGKVKYGQFSPDQSVPKTSATVRDITTEAEDIQKINKKRKAQGRPPVRYERVTITDDMPPLPKDVDRLVKIIAQAQKEKKNIHFHCVAGQGRTTTAMVIADIMAGMSLQKALRFEIKQGGKDLRSIRADEVLEPLELRGCALRLGILKKFAKYWKSTGGEKTSFSAYMKKNPMDEDYLLKMVGQIKILPARRHTIRHGKAGAFDAA